MACGIYRIDIGPKFYFGQSCDIDKRIADHIYNLQKDAHCNKYMQAAFRKYGTFDHTIVVRCAEQHLDAHEQELIDAFYDDRDCMNISKFVGSPMRGRKHSETAKKRIADAHRGSSRSEETRLRMSLSQRGRTVSDETRKKMSEASLRIWREGERHPFRPSGSNSGVAVPCWYSLNGEQHIFGSVVEMASSLGVSEDVCHQWLSGRRPLPGQGQRVRGPAKKLRGIQMGRGKPDGTDQA